MDAKYKLFLIGLGIGIVLLVVMYAVISIRNSRSKRELYNTIRRLKGALNDKMELESEGISDLKREREELRKENENLRISLSVALQKHDAREVMRAQVLQSAVDKLLLSTPGFGTSWTAALKEAERESETAYSGKAPFLKRIFASAMKIKEAPIPVEDKSEQGENNGP